MTELYLLVVPGVILVAGGGYVLLRRHRLTPVAGDRPERAWAKQARKTRWTRRINKAVSIANAPIVLLVLTALAGSGIAFAYRNFNACNSVLHGDRQRLSKLLNELSYRHNEIRGIPAELSQNPRQAISLLDRDVHYKFLEFKGMRTNEWEWHIGQISGKYCLHDVIDKDNRLIQEAEDISCVEEEALKLVNVNVIPVDELTRLASTAAQDFDVANDDLKDEPLSNVSCVCHVWWPPEETRFGGCGVQSTRPVANRACRPLESKHE